MGLANRRDSIPRRLSPYLNPRFSAHRGCEWDALSRESIGACRTSCRCRSVRPVRSGVAQHAQADACNPEFMFSKMSTPASWDYRLRLPNRFPTVSRRLHPVALASAGTPPSRWQSTEPLTRRHDSPVRPVVPGTASVRLESSRPPCGETERRPDSGAPPPLLPASTACAGAFARLGPTHWMHRLVQSSRPTDTLGALCAQTARPFDHASRPVRVRNDDFHRRCQLGQFKEQPSSQIGRAHV